jgi:hypothetical protein
VEAATLSVSTSVAGALRARETAAGVTVRPAGVLAVMVTVSLKPLMGASESALVPDPEGEIWTSGFRAFRENSDCVMVTFTALETAAL